MSIEIFILLLTIIFLITALYLEIFHPAAVFFIAVSVLVITGILSPSQALAGFSNEQIATIILLLLVSNLIQKVGVVNYYFSKVLKDSLSYRAFLGKMFLMVSSLSSFLNNTPIVAMLIPYVYQWGKKKKISPSRLLIPLSYAAILGGTITLIGTSTNLLVSGLAVQQGLQPLGIFDFALVGIPATIAGFIYMFFWGYKLLPERKDVLETFLERKKEYLVETIVRKDSPLIGKSIKEAELRNLKGLFLIEIIRGSKKISPVSPEEILEENDILIFAGQTESITELLSTKTGLSLPQFCTIDGEKVDVVEVVISNNSSLINKKVRDTDFRAKFDAAILAVHRNGEKLRGKIGEIVLKPGDLLLLLTGKDFWKRAEDTTDFYIVSRVREIFNIDLKKGNLVFLSFLGVIILSALGFISLFTGLLILIAGFVIFRLTSYSEIKKGLDISLIIIAALSLAIGAAMHVTGTADLLAGMVESVLSPLGVIGALIGIYLFTNVLTEFITNIAAASIAFPVAVSLAESFSVEPTAFILAVAYGASASFVTPIGYQTNLMVYSVGNYKFKDFVKVGLPLSVIYAIICISLLYFLFLQEV
ncbi:SLC13 family permease [Persephonella sp.]